MYKHILFIFFYLFSIDATAQLNNEIEHDVVTLLYVPVKETYLTTSLNLIQFAQLDNMVSPLVYMGFGAGASLGLQRRKKERITSYHIHRSQANLYNDVQPKQYSSSLIHVNVNISTSYLLKKINYKNIKARLGWQLAQQSDFRRNIQLQNSSLTYNLTTTLSPVFHVEKWLSIKENKQRKLFKNQRSMRLSYQFSMPVLAAVARPPFNAIRKLNDNSGNAYQNSLSQEVISNLKIYTSNDFIALNSKLAFEYFLKNNTRLSLQFYWNFERFNVENSAYKVSQTGFQLSVLTRLSAL